MDNFIYTDDYIDAVESKISNSLNITIIKRFPEDTWNISDAMRIITSPELELAIINKIDSISLMEISLLHFMCKKILVTTNSVNTYPAIARTVDYIDVSCTFMSEDNNFIQWYKLWKDGQWN